MPNDDGHIKIDVINADLPMKCLAIVARVYNHPNSNKHTKNFIRFELQKLFGRDYDIIGFLNDPEYKID
ncbi:hypothetical protein [Paucisalibacillus globulus]|uniref:hypothetical protein n=1 Tax=Paucisalibacillus globulus TaxID=351095 RepID=UPI000402BADC|nr:hypothetical protein [Paucisalibacillus globulus]